MAGKDLEASLFDPGKRFWIVGPTYDLGEKEFRVIWDDLIVKLQLGRDRRVKRSYNKKAGNMFIEFPWQTRLEVRSADHPENLVGEALDWCIMSEAAKHRQETWERFIRPALADKRGGADFPTTPEGHNWYYDLWMLGKNPSLPEYEAWRFPSWENSAVYPLGRQDPEIILLERTMTPEAFLQEIGADFSSFTGKIYPEWDVESFVQNVEYIPGLPSYMCVDFGYTNPLAAIEFQVTPDDRVRIWREHYKPYMTLSEHIRTWKTRDNPEGYHLDMVFGDSEDPEGVATISEKFAPCMALPQAKTNWREGVDLVRSFMTMRETGRDIDEYGTPEETPALVVDFKCVHTISEFNNYKAKAPRAGTNVPEMGHKMMDHAMDAVRYGFMHVFKLGATAHLADVMDSTPLVVSTNRTTQGELTLIGSDAGSGFFTTIGDF
jgi:hypothetical protein